MTTLFQQAVGRAQALSPEMQDEIARMVLAFAGDEQPLYQFTAEEEAEQDAIDAEEARGEYATADEVLNIWGKHGL